MRFLICFVLFPYLGVAQNLSTQELELYRIINEYRIQNNLKEIPISPNLCKVARIHAEDLVSHPPKGKCNFHSWSSHGNWTAMCYTDNHNQAEKMWNKPQELTNYEGRGYEIAFWSSDTAFTAVEALTGWQKSPGHNNCILNKKNWKNAQWNAIGICIYKNYALVWFGEEIDN